MKFRVDAIVTISVHTDVEARSAREAKKIAMDRSLIGLCHQCGGGDTSNEEWVTSGELDGEPKDPKVLVEPARVRR